MPEEDAEDADLAAARVLHTAASNGDEDKVACHHPLIFTSFVL
jgi:hypothetical protein